MTKEEKITYVFGGNEPIDVETILTQIETLKNLLTSLYGKQKWFVSFESENDNTD